MPLQTTFRADASRAYQQLRDAHAGLWSRLDYVSWALPDSVVGATKTALNLALVNIGKLAPTGSMTVAVESGSRTPAQWQSMADATLDLLTTASTNVGQALPSFSRLADEVLVPTINQARAEVSEVVGKGAELVPWVAAALIALVLGYVIFSFRRV